MSVTLEQIIATCLLTPRKNPLDPSCIWGLPLNIVGLVGCGKSERIEDACRAVQLPMYTVFPSTHMPEDFAGAPYATPDGIRMECTLPQANRLRDIGYGVLLIDELSTARPAVQTAALGLVNDRRVGDHILPPRVRILTAMNPAEYAAGGFVLEAPLANRMMHLPYVVPPAEDWVEWLWEMSPSHLEPIRMAEQRVLSSWNNHWSHIKGLAGGFMKANSSKLHEQPPPDNAAASGAWPSHRMWNWAIRGIATARCLGMPSDIEPKIVAGCVGDGVMAEWVTWMANADLPTPEEMLTKGWRPDPQRLDVTLAAMGSMGLWVTGIADPAAQAHFAALAWHLVDATHEAGLTDIAVKPASMLTTRGLAKDHADQRLAKVAREVILKLGRSGYSKFATVLS